MAVDGPLPARIEESKKFLRLAERAMVEAFELEGDKEERLLERSAFRSFEAALELSFAQVQNDDLRPRALEASLYDAAALQDLKDAAASSENPAVIAAAALAASLAAEKTLGSGRSAEEFVRALATRLYEMAQGGGEQSVAAGEYLGSIQFHLLKDISGAGRTLQQAVAAEPARHRAWDLLILASAYEGPEKFVETAQARVMAMPAPRSSVLLVKSFDMQGDLTRAEWTALNAVASYPNDVLANLTLAAVLMKDPNAADYLWRVEDALNKAEKALGSSRNHQNRIDFYLLKGISLGLSDRADQARTLLRDIKPSSPELQEVLRALDTLD
jgi:hypothetical protein